MNNVHLAQANYSSWIKGISVERMMEFSSKINDVNKLAESSPGFVWRYESYQEQDTEVERVFGDKRIIFNMSIWQSLDALKSFAFKSDHTHVMKQRSKWFEKLNTPFSVLWWIPNGHRPSVEEAWKKFQHLEQYGASQEAFGFDSYQSPPVLGVVE